MTHQAKKHFGQNFLHDQNIIDKIVTVIAPKPDDFMIEIGPGLGALTRYLLPHLNHLTAIEIDRDVIEHLETTLPQKEKLTLHHRDVLKFDFDSIKTNKPMRVVGNLPYNISTPILFRLVEQVDFIQDVHVMLQKEVVDRIAAKPGSKTYGRLGVVLQYFFKPLFMFNVPPNTFKPQPKVNSAILRLTPNHERSLSAEQEKAFVSLVKQSFSSRRKTLRNNLKGQFDMQILIDAGIDPADRAEALSVDQYVSIIKAATAL